MPSKDQRVPLRDIKENIELARQFITDLSFKDLCSRSNGCH